MVFWRKVRAVLRALGCQDALEIFCSMCPIASYSLSYIPIYPYCLNLYTLELEFLLLEFQGLQSGWIKLAKKQRCHLYNQVNSSCPLRWILGCADHRTETLTALAFWGVAYRGLTSILPCLGISLSWKELTMPGQCGGRKVWPPGLHLGHLWRIIQLQSSVGLAEASVATVSWFNFSLCPVLLPFLPYRWYSA